MKVFLLCSILFALNACQSVTTQPQKSEFKRVKDEATRTPPPEPDNPFLSETHENSMNLLEKAILESDVNTIRKALQGRFLSIKSRAVLALTKLDDKASIPDLVQLLKTNQGLIDGGSEIQYEQNLLNKVIVLGLEKLTDLKFEATEKLLKIEGKGYSPLSPEDIQEIEEKIANLDLKKNASGQKPSR